MARSIISLLAAVAVLVGTFGLCPCPAGSCACPMMEQTPLGATCCDGGTKLGPTSSDSCSGSSIDTLAPEPGPSIEAPGPVAGVFRVRAAGTESVALPPGPRFVPKPTKTVLLI